MQKTHKEFSLKPSRRTFRSQLQRKRMTFKDRNIERPVLKDRPRLSFTFSLTKPNLQYLISYLYENSEILVLQ